MVKNVYTKEHRVSHTSYVIYIKKEIYLKILYEYEYEIEKNLNMSKVSKRVQMILSYRYADKITFKAISERMNIPMVSVDVIDYSAER